MFECAGFGLLYGGLGLGMIVAGGFIVGSRLGGRSIPTRGSGEPSAVAAPEASRPDVAEPDASDVTTSTSRDSEPVPV